jgi:Flp pilus assembly pilin Flp
MKKLLRDRKGVTVPEYAVMLSLVAVAVLIAAPTLTDGVMKVFSYITTTIGAGIP